MMDVDETRTSTTIELLKVEVTDYAARTPPRDAQFPCSTVSLVHVDRHPAACALNYVLCLRNFFGKWTFACGADEGAEFNEPLVLFALSGATQVTHMPQIGTH